MFRVSSVLSTALEITGLTAAGLNESYDMRKQKRIGPFGGDDEVPLRITKRTGMGVYHIRRRNRILLVDARTKAFWYREDGLRKVSIDFVNAQIPNTVLTSLAGRLLTELADLGDLSSIFAECRILGGSSYSTGVTSIRLDPAWILVADAWEWKQLFGMDILNEH